MDQTLEIKAALQIRNSTHEVFEAIVDPAKMSNYFISRGSGRMEAGNTITWRFPEFKTDFPIRVNKIDPDKYISFYWEFEGNDLLVEMTLESAGKKETIVTVTEKSMPNNEAGIKWLKGNTEGWANFLACLKAYIEYGINLRKGAFEFFKTTA
jgi:uncharacterized protein YndB with AHSA1/START domain